jgi:hypothetical protein
LKGILNKLRTFLAALIDKIRGRKDRAVYAKLPASLTTTISND